MRTICRVTLLVLVLVVAVTVSPLAAQTRAPTSAPAAATTTPPALVPFLQAIREANTLSAASAAYSGGAAVDRQNVELNTAYMRRLLQLGLPQAAGTPAALLASIPVSDGLAYGVLGYNCGRQNDLPKALTNTMQGAGLLQDDNSIQNNLGMLVAWYEGAKTYKLTATDQEALDRLKTQMASKPAYADGYQLIKVGYDKLLDANSQKQQKVDAAAADANAALKKVVDAQAKVKALTDEDTADKQQLTNLERQQGAATPAPRGGRRGGPGPGGANAQITQLATTIADLEKTKIPAANKEAQDAATDLAKKKQALEQAQKIPLDAVPLAKLFQWLPPAVDGVVTLPPSTTSRPTSAPAAGAGA